MKTQSRQEVSQRHPRVKAEIYQVFHRFICNFDAFNHIVGISIYIYSAKSYTDIALETELKRDMENADAIHKLVNKKSEEKNLPRSAINLMKIQKCITKFPRF